MALNAIAPSHAPYLRIVPAVPLFGFFSRMRARGFGLPGAAWVLLAVQLSGAEETAPLPPLTANPPVAVQPAPAGEKSAERNPAWSEARLRETVAKLSSESFDERESASQALDHAPLDQFRALSQAASRTEDPETRARLHSVLEKIFREKLLPNLAEWKMGRGFLGIQWSISNDPPGVQVDAVISGTSAEKAGLKAGDLILRIDGKLLEAGFSSEDAVKIWKSMAPGDSMKLLLQRGPGAEQEVNLTIGEMPREYASEENEEHRSSALWERYLRGNLKIPDHLLRDAPKPLQSWPRELEAKE